MKNRALSRILVHGAEVTITTRHEQVQYLRSEYLKNIGFDGRFRS